MHVGIDGTTWRNERGFGRFTRGVLEALAARDSGFRYTLICDQEPSYPVPQGVDIVVAPKPDGADVANRFQMHQATLRLGCDVFFCPTVFSYYPLMSRVPKVICIHDTIPERFPDLIFPSKLNFMLWKAKTTIAKLQATRFITGSESSAQDLQSILGIPRNKIDLTTMAAAPVFKEINDNKKIEEIRAEYNIPSGARVLVYVGGFNRHKNVLSLIHAMPLILEQHPDAFLAIVGRTTGDRFWDNVEDLQASARANVIASDRIIFTGEISDEKLALLINASHALVHPSLYEGFGFPPVEAMACGTPVLGSDASSVPEVVGDGGLLFDPTDASSIAHQTNRLLSDDDLHARLSQQAIRQAAKFTWARAAEMTEISFENAFGKRL
ncbi:MULTISPECIES: glycosyltransferase family 1 protein [unclassified Ruegeria]|uniref:glycosyltransferase family 4 protein n=1 Tax=unclassified Ruegeria TaxID=2625375 RepID=UPI00148802C5|nr:MULTISPECIES: glycosyltransferase family 1 protein [unclassified Ruegeria]NOD65552.1 glycosyltransferase [Ruegeria sp. HKCCD6109]